MPNACGSVTITRGRVIAAFRALPPDAGITTLGLAGLLDCPEYPVRAAGRWLALGGLVTVAGEHVRRDGRGKRYGARIYRWTGREDIQRVARDETQRRCQAEQPVQALAAQWLSRRWVQPCG